MSKLRLRIKIANNDYTVDPETGYYILDNGVVVNPETGEVIEDNQDINEKLKNVLFDTKKQAYHDYPSDDYKNQWGKVSPFNILFIDRINEIYSMTPDSAKNFIIQTIEDLNNKYGYDDDSYDYVSKNYINKLSYRLQPLKTIDGIIQMITDIYFKGIGMGMSNMKRTSTLKIDINNKKELDILIKALTKLATLN